MGANPLSGSVATANRVPPPSRPPGKLPSRYVDITLARLMPPASYIERLDTDALVKLAEQRRQLALSIRQDPVKYFIPNPGGQSEFLNCGISKHRVFLYVAGNKNGKSTAGAVRFIEQVLGRAIWDRERRSVENTGAVRSAVFAEDFETHKEVTQPTLETWAPPGSIKHKTKNAAGQVVEFFWANGSITSFRTYDQGSDKAEGKDWTIVWCDEPPPRDVYTAVFRGLVALDGRMFITATLIKEAWLFDEGSEKPYIKVIEGTIHENRWLPQEAKDEFLDVLDDEERLVRETGRPASLVGVVYKQFYDREPYVITIDEAPDPNKCVLIAGVDPHERRPLYVEYAWLDPYDNIYWFQWLLLQGSIDFIFSKLAIAEQEIGRRPAIVYMDPNRGPTKQLGGASWQSLFEEAGYSIELGRDDLRVGHTQVARYLASGQMKWIETCRGKGGPIYQMLRYSWDDRLASKRRNLAPLEKPKDAFKDFPDIHRYVAMAEPKYDNLVSGYSVVDLIDHKRPDNRGIVTY